MAAQQLAVVIGNKDSRDAWKAVQIGKPIHLPQDQRRFGIDFGIGQARRDDRGAQDVGLRRGVGTRIDQMMGRLALVLPLAANPA